MLPTPVCRPHASVLSPSNLSIALKAFNLWIFRLAAKIRSGRAFQIFVEERTDAMRCHLNLTTAIEAYDA
jgi:hypothetical protein